MIKCILSGKSLKQLFFISLISCFILLGNSFVNAQDFRLGLTTPVQGSNRTGATFTLQDNGNFLTNGSYKYFINNPNYNYFVSLSWIDRKLYVIVSDGNLNVQNQGFVNCFGLGDYRYDPNGYYGGGCGTTETPISLTPDEFYLSGTFRNPDGFKVVNILYDNSTYCFIYSDINKQVCFYASPDVYNQMNLFTGSLGFTSNPKPEDFAGSQLSHYVGNSPFSSISSDNNNQIDIIDYPDGYDYTKINSGDIVFYFENSPLYRFDKNVCYVGTNDYSTLYSSGSTLGLFKWGSGGSVFDLYGSQFGNSFSIKDLGTFINTWDINYYTWFKGANRDENNKPIYNAYYSLSSGFYQDFGDNLSVPFIGNPIAFYFMGYVSSLYGNQSTLGEEIATYCYYKLNYDENPGDFTIIDNSDGSYWDNANSYINQHNRFYGLNSGGINIEAQSWDGSILDYYSGYDEKYDFNTFFSSSFNKFKDVISLNSSDLGAGVLPTYIILFFMAIILFRFLSH